LLRITARSFPASLDARDLRSAVAVMHAQGFDAVSLQAT
jgi:hypothetical protein